MKRIAMSLAVAAAAATFAPAASAEPLCVYGHTPYPIYCAPDLTWDAEPICVYGHTPYPLFCVPAFSS